MPISHVIGFDDCPFPHDHRGNITVVGAVYAGPRLEGILSGQIRRDGANAARTLAQMVKRSKFAGHLQLVMLQGIALGGFNVVDVHFLHQTLNLPVLVIARRQPDMVAIKQALLTRVPGGARKWRLIERLGPMEPVAGVHVQRVGLTLIEADNIIKRFALHGHIPEPLRTAHLIAGGIGTGQSRGRT
jgi:endonuclease V-like protein UPF0215 family